jgi:hypothetical protein
VTDISICDRNQLDAMPGLGPKGSDPTALVFRIVRMSPEADDIKLSVIFHLSVQALDARKKPDANHSSDCV